MDFVFYLSYEDIIQIHADVVDDSGGGTGVRLEAGIHSAIVAPRVVYYGAELYPTIAEKGAIICFELVTQHPFVDGNKRVGHSAMAHFLFMNGYIIDANDEEQEEIILALAAGEIDKETFTNWVKTKITEFK